MCRYAFHTYKEHYACFHCRKMFRRPPRADLVHHIEKDTKRICPCPQCSNPMQNLGLDFKPPKQSDIKQWAKVKELVDNGFTFASCGCGGPGPRPATLKDVKPFIKEQKRINDEWKRNTRITQKAEELATKRKKRKEQRMTKILRNTPVTDADWLRMEQ